MSITTSRVGIADLDGGEADAGRVVHGLEHVVGELARSSSTRLDRVGHAAQVRIGQREDFAFGHGERSSRMGRDQAQVRRGRTHVFPV